MIKFFRNIRKNLIKEGKLKSYLLYALGEIVLVVAGILIALAINNKNEERKRRAVEIDILEGIKQNIYKDTVDLNFNIGSYKTLIKNDSILLTHLMFQKPLNDEIHNRFMFAVQSGLILTLHRSAFDEAKEEGLSIIQNKKLRDSISRLYEFDYLALLRAENEAPEVDGYLVVNKTLEPYFELSASGSIITPEIYERILADKNAHYQLAKGLNLKKTMLQGFYLPTKEKALKVAAAIEQELKQREN